MNNEIIIFENQDVKLEVNMKDETVWLNVEQMSKLFGRDSKTIVAPKSDELGEFVERLAERSEIIRNCCDPRIDNMLLVTNDGRKAALDLRMIDPNMPDLPNSKINMAVENIYRIWLEKEMMIHFFFNISKVWAAAPIKSCLSQVEK